jgi:hypothetical protein
VSESSLWKWRKKRLKLTIAHLDDNQMFELTYDQLASYGFEM